MRFGSLIIIALICPVFSQAAPYVYPFNAMTGEQVVGKLLKELSAEIDYIERDMVHSYVNGVKDATQGGAWCFVGAMLQHESNIELAFAIKATRRQRTHRPHKGQLIRVLSMCGACFFGPKNKILLWPRR